MTIGRWEQEGLRRPIKAPGQLLVEGRTAEIFFLELAKQLGLSDRVEVRTFGGIDDLREYVEIFAQEPDFKENVHRLAIIRDAEEPPALAAFQSVQSVLQKTMLPAPDAIGGIEGSPIGVGVYVLPDCRHPGTLETLCLSAIEESERGSVNPLLPCVDEFFACLRNRGKESRRPVKARSAAYLLAHDVIDPQLGRAAQQGVIPWKAKAFDPLKNFLAQVAGQ